MVKLRVQDGELTCSLEICRMSLLMKEMLTDDSTEQDEIPLPNVTKATMEQVIKFCEHHLTHAMPEIQRPIKSADVKVILKDFPWDAEFIDIDDQEMLFNIVLAANCAGGFLFT